MCESTAAVLEILNPVSNSSGFGTKVTKKLIRIKILKTIRGEISKCLEKPMLNDAFLYITEKHSGKLTP
jgi:hypothetical protein